MNKVKFSLFLPTGDFAKARAAAEWADTHGFYSVSINDHFFSPLGAPQTPQLECYATLSAIASITKNIRLAPAVTAMSFRSPAMLAKMTATLDHISNGRFIFGVGSGWQRSEYDAHGYPYPNNVERLDQLHDALKLIKCMWTQEEPTYKGRYFAIEKAYNHPRPVQKPHPPIMVGGASKKLLQIVAAEGQIANLIPPIVNGKDFVQDPQAAVKFDKPELKRRIDMLNSFIAEAGRPAGSVEVSGIAMVNILRSKSEADAAIKATTAAMGFANDEAMRNAPVALIGTPDEVRRELRSRIEEFGMTYFVVFPRSDEARDLLAEEIMPEFA
ncbi:MAG: LLM class flavin-dependent oxidoreductase [Deltaproteobacteria bacterium]|nr:LLM class flavin-dependent oxidoreductase [Deltaproteobacteria bacterium]